ncbi:ribonuclease P protein component [Ascidiimonas aurantiaca]|uniref:ribonuclease P protein component n=1 Tax=Ascidiimonas aurantiaca TaxID=1685432 RepID=UPI0030EBA1AA
MNYHFSREEKLKSRKQIRALFTEGISVKEFPLKLIYLKVPSETPVALQAAFSVPKRNFSKAVKRNRIKRLMREAYRLQKPHFFNKVPTSYALMFLYIGRQEPDFKKLNLTMHALMEKFLEQTTRPE